MSELILTTEQKQGLSQRAIQNIEILQMSAQELESYLNKTALENPVIELEPSSLSKEDARADTEYSKDTHLDVEYSGEDTQTGVEYSKDGTPSDADSKDKAPSDIETPEDEYPQPVRKQHARLASHDNVIEQMAATPANSLSEHVLFQLIPHFHNETDKSVLYYLVESLDDNGFLTVTPDTLCEIFQVSPDTARHYVAMLQSVEPTGIGASNLTECLLLQLERSEHPRHDLAARIISGHLEKVANNQIKPLARALGSNVAEVSEAIALIKTLNPRPANGFCRDEFASYICPDVIILQKHNHFQIMINGDLAAGFKINDTYRPMLNHPDREVREYLYQKFQQADWISKCLEQLNATLLRITRQILLNHMFFFLNGPVYIPPLSQAAIGKQLELNDSTISRAIHDKYLECFWGVFPFKYFFSSSVPNGTSDMTVGHLKGLIKKLIDEEDKSHPLSDQKIASILNGQGILAARRTIAKYRNEMLIPDTSRRRTL